MSSDEPKLPTDSSDVDELPSSSHIDTANTHDILAREILRIEQARIDRDNRESDLQERALELSDVQDRRRAEFYGHSIQLEDNADKRRTRLISWVLLGGFSIVALPLALLFYMVFWGSVEQRDTAVGILRTGGIALAGYGVITALIGASASIFKRPNKR